MRNRVTFSLRSDFFLLLALTLFLLPIQWVFGWVIAGFLHEVSHIGMMYMQKVRIVAISISASGAVIKSGHMSNSQEFFCALAGPIGGFLAIGFIRIMPEITICAVLQSAFNLLPAYPLDGGRAIKCVVSHFWSEAWGETVSKCLTLTVLALLMAIGFWLLLRFQMSLMLPTVFLFLSIMKNSLHCRKNDSTIQSNLERIEHND